MSESIGHRPLRGRCPAPFLNLKHNLLGQGTGTADHLTLLRLLHHYQHNNSVGMLLIDKLPLKTLVVYILGWLPEDIYNFFLYLSCSLE